MLEGHKGHVAAAAFLATNTLITVSGDSTAALWDLNRLPSSDIDQRAEVFAGHDECLSAVAKDPTSDKNFATGSADGSGDALVPRCERPVVRVAHAPGRHQGRVSSEAPGRERRFLPDGPHVRGGDRVLSGVSCSTRARGRP